MIKMRELKKRKEYDNMKPIIKGKAGVYND